MDNSDKSILFRLVQSCRISFSQLATDLKLTPDDVGVRIQRMVNDHTILKFSVALNPYLLHLHNAIVIFRSLTPLELNRLTLLGIHSAIEYISIGTAHEGFAYARCSDKKDFTELAEHFQQFHSSFEELHLYPVIPLVNSGISAPTQDLVSLEKEDWLILAHLREQGRLSLQELSNRIEIDVGAINERMDYLRHHNLIHETIQINPVKSPKETLTMFQCEFTILNHLIQEEIMQEINTLPYFWSISSWRSIDKPILFLSFYSSSYTEVEKVQAQLTELPGVKSIIKIMGGTTYYFTDLRDELIEEKRSHGWFSPEKWVTDYPGN
ncbi:MAG: AsnC family transcriptional regulator [Candidatus Hodarchaeales archaeon]|jgi:DNA-binding Lrp family transcriptional regulator